MVLLALAGGGALPALKAWLFPTVIEGLARVVDGDTIEIAGRRIRLGGIDAPELRQTCLRDGSPAPCGREVQAQFADYLSSRSLRCHVYDTDAYRRSVARCAAGAEDVALWLLANGFARSTEGGAYQRAEREAERARRGLWAGEWQDPRQFRQDHPR